MVASRYLIPAISAESSFRHADMAARPCRSTHSPKATLPQAERSSPQRWDVGEYQPSEYDAAIQTRSVAGSERMLPACPPVIFLAAMEGAEASF